MNQLDNWTKYWLPSLKLTVCTKKMVVSNGNPLFQGFTKTWVSQSTNLFSKKSFDIPKLGLWGSLEPEDFSPKKHGVFPHAFLRRGSTQRSKDDVFSRCAGQSLGFLVDEMGRRTIWTKMFWWRMLIFYMEPIPWILYYTIASFF